jgi:hypothetical protein
MKITQLFEATKEKTIADIPWVSKILDEDGNMPESSDHLEISGWKITTLRGISKHIKTYCDIASNELSNLDFLPSHIGTYLKFSNNKINSLSDIHKRIKYVKKIDCKGNPIESKVLGLLKINGLEQVEMYDPGGHIFGITYPEINKKLKTVEEIINRYIPHGDLIECQNELIDAGLQEYARL